MQVLANMLRRFLMFRLGEKNDEPIIVENNKIYYTSNNNSTITPYSTTVFGANIVSNTFDDLINKYVIEFDGPVTQAGSNAFRSRSALSSIILPNTVTSIGDRAFYYCSNITQIDCGSGVKTLGASVFSTCELLEKVILGPNVTSVGQYCFYGCGVLSEIHLPTTTPPTGAYSMLEGVPDTCKIYIPSGSINAYSSAKYWSDYSSMFVEK